MESLGLNSSLPPLRAEKGGGGEMALLGTLRSSFELLISQARDYVPSYRVPSSPKKLPSFHWVVILAIVC